MIKALDSTARQLINKMKRAALRIGAKMVDQVTHPGIKPRPFMRAAFDRAQDAALDATVQYIRTRLPKEIAKAKR